MHCCWPTFAMVADVGSSAIRFPSRGHIRKTKQDRPIVTMEQLEVGSGGHFSPSVWPHNPPTGFRPPSATVVSAEPFSHGTRTLRCLQKEMATYRHWSVSLWQDPDDVPHCRILSPDQTEWRLISATLCGCRRCSVADQLWFMTCIREEEDCGTLLGSWHCWFYCRSQIISQTPPSGRYSCFK